MRFARLDLLRFGPFTDTALDFPAPTGKGDPDLHLIVGPNEAGKSTLRDAVGAFLFGIHGQTRHGWRHGYRDLRLGAEIAAEDGHAQTLAAHRVKGNSRTLREAATDRPLPDGTLAPWLGGVDKDTYRRVFALDQEALRQGGEELLSHNSTLAQVLFESASGIGDFAQIQSALASEADGLFHRNGKRKTAMRTAKTRLNDAESRLKAVTTTDQTYKDAERARADAEQTVQAADAERRKLQAERDALQRLKAAAPEAAHLDALDARLADLRDGTGALPPQLPADAADRLREAREELARLDTDQQQAKADRDKARQDRAALTLAPEVLAAEDRLAKLRDDARRRHDLPDNLSAKQREVGDWWREATAAAEALGWPADDRATLRRHLPARLTRETVAARKAALDTAAQDLKAKRAEAARLQAALAKDDRALADLPAGRVSQALRDALAAARDLGDPESARAQAAENVATAHKVRADAWRKLAPFAGDAAALRALDPPPVQAGRDAAETRADLDRQWREVEQTLADKDRTRAAKQAEADALRAEGTVVEAEAVAAARQRRDALWTGIRGGTHPLAETAETFDTALHEADTLVDRRLAQHTEAAHLDALTRETRRLAAEIAAQDRPARDALQTERDAAATAWTERMTPLGLETLPAAAYADWCVARESALAAEESLEAARAAETRLEARLAEAHAALAQALAADGTAQDPDGVAVAELALPRLVRLAGTHVETADTARGERQSREAHRADNAAALETAKAEAATAESTHTAAHTALAEALRAAGLPETLADAALDNALNDALHQCAILAERLAWIDKTTAQDIAPGEETLCALDTEARACAAAVAPDLETAGRDTFALAEALGERLDAARTARDEAARLDKHITEQNARIDRAEAGRQRVEANLAPLYDQAGLDGAARTPKALQAAIDAAERRREVESQRTETEKKLRHHVEDLSLDDLRARLDAQDAEARDTRLHEIDSALEHADAKVREAVQARTEAQGRLDAVAVGDATGSPAEAAEAEHQSAVAECADIAQRYIGARVRANLLGWAVDHYREDYQSPMLRRAGTLFATLTDGAFAGLIAGTEDPPRLYGRRPDPDGAHLDTDAMSEGTRDQLYLALRLAAVERQVDQGAPLPFIADDLFVNADDTRAAAGFRALAALARRTQVIYLSHHAHLAPIARATLGDRVNVIALDGPDAGAEAATFEETTPA